MYRKIITLLLLFFFSLSLLVQNSFALSNAPNMSSVKLTSPVKPILPVKASSLDNKVAGNHSAGLPSKAKVAPVQVKGVSYKLQDGVRYLPLAASKMFTVNNDSFFLKKGINNFNPKIGQIFIDSESNVPMKIASVNTKSPQASYTMVDPSIDEIISDFNIPKQTIVPNKGNVVTQKGVTFSTKDKLTLLNTNQNSIETKMATGVQFAPSNDSQSIDNSVGGEIHHFDIVDMTLISYKSDDGNTSVSVKANGFVELQEPKFELEGKFDDGFKVNFSAYENAQVSLSGTVKLKQDVSVPIGGYEVPFAIGKVYVGIYLDFKVNGEIDISIKVNQRISIDVGVSSKLWLLIPYDFETHCNLENRFGVEPKIDGKIHAEAFIEPKAGIEMFDKKIGELALRLGLSADASINEKNVDLEVDGVFKVTASLFSEDFTLMDKKWELYESHKRYMNDFDINLTKADSFTGRVEGTVKKGKGDYTGDTTIEIKHEDGSITNINNVRCENGKLSANVHLVKLDKIILKINDIESQPILASFPFHDISVNADSYNKIIKGRIDGNYSGPLDLFVGRDEKYSRYTVNCINGDFKVKFSKLKTNDDVYASLKMNGFVVENFPVYAKPLLNINVKLDKSGVRATIENVGGDVPSYMGKVKISEDYTTLLGIETSISHDQKSAEVNTSITPNNTKSNSKDKTKETSNPIYAAGKTTYVNYDGFKRPQDPCTVYLKVSFMYEGYEVSGVDYIDTLSNKLKLKKPLIEFSVMRLPSYDIRTNPANSINVINNSSNKIDNSINVIN